PAPGPTAGATPSGRSSTTGWCGRRWAWTSSGVHRFLTGRLLPHERAEERALYPAMGQVLGGPEVTMTMSRAHAEIERLVRRLGRHLDLAENAGLRPEQLDDLRSCLYGLHAVLLLHFDQEEEAYFSLALGAGSPA
ncbi:hemerythrin domain-containing protein, partial [Streptosporangium sandarakinum]